MNKRRLLKLADLLERDAKNKGGVKFDLDQWGETEKLKKFVRVDCNTQACAIGLACISGAFKRDGLGFEIDADGAICPTLPNPDYGGWGDSTELSGWSAVEEFFQIDRRTARRLFNPRKGQPRKGAVAERAVANRIREYVASVQ